MCSSWLVSVLAVYLHLYNIPKRQGVEEKQGMLKCMHAVDLFWTSLVAAKWLLNFV